MKKDRLILIEDHFVIVLPDNDIRPHGTKISETKYEITSSALCPCEPRVISGIKGEVYAKPIVVHNSFRDLDAIEISLNKIYA